MSRSLHVRLDDLTRGLTQEQEQGRIRCVEVRLVDEAGNVTIEQWTPRAELIEDKMT